jgi:hypothetical protein
VPSNSSLSCNESRPPVAAPATPSNQDSLDMIQLKNPKSSSSIGTFPQ